MDSPMIFGFQPSVTASIDSEIYKNQLHFLFNGVVFLDFFKIKYRWYYKCQLEMGFDDHQKVVKK